MKKMIGVLFALGVLASAAIAVHQRGAGDSAQQWPAPIDSMPGERDPDFKGQRRAWIESLHRHAPGDDWRAIDSAYRSGRIARTQAERAARLRDGASFEDLRRFESTAVSGEWRERGSRNQAGRITSAIYDASANRLTALSQGGNIWRAGATTLDWQSTADNASFNSNGFLDRLGGPSGERLLIGSDTPQGFYRSDDGGATFARANGTDSANPWYMQSLAVRDDTSSDVYFLRVHYDFTAPADWRTMLFSSTDRGANFVSRGIIGPRDRVALFSPRYGSSEVYVLNGAVLQRIVPGTQVLQMVGTVPVSPAVASGDRVALTGGVAGGQVFLYALYSRGSVAHTDVYRSLDGGVTWQARTPAPAGMFGPNSAASSTRDPNFLYVGGIDLFRSSDGGASWAAVNAWGEYYSAPATKLHADIPNVDVWIDSENVERVYVSTDGGLYESLDTLLTVRNLSLANHNVSQYYSTYTQRVAPHAVLGGSQDQGYQKIRAPTGGIESFEQPISGDYGHLTSSDGGSNVWMVYPNFAMLDTAPASAGQGGLRLWNFGPAGFTGSLWMTPIVADPTDPRRILLAGGTLGAGGNRVITLTYSGTSFTASESTFNFGSQVTAIAVSAHAADVHYAVSSARDFFRQSAGTWVNTNANLDLPPNHYFYGNKILSDPAVPGRLYVGGAGYSNPPVFVSTNDGTTFAPMATGLPNTLVFDMAISSDGAHLFAATEVGAFYFDRAQSQWIDLTGLGAPDQRYWSVDVVTRNGITTARFGTHGRGIWDFTVTGDAIFSNGFE